MDDLGNYDDRIGRYIHGRLTEAERVEFEEALGRDPSLVEEVGRARLLAAGLAVQAHVTGDHPEPLDITAFALEPSELDSGLRSRIEAHLRDCPECRVEVELCRQSAQAMVDRPVPASAIRPRWWAWLAGAQPRLAVATVAAAALVLFTGLFLGRTFFASAPPTARIELSAASERGEQTKNLVRIGAGSELVSLEFLVPSREGRRYDLVLADGAQNEILTLHNQLHRIPFSLAVPAAYLAAGSYEILVIEQVDASQPMDTLAPDTFRIRFETAPAR
ncbi:MAG TPA: zf-HC2 domain-containing protein [candidate division Zixibacteria bacterium]|nr:hypothetical protein [candidate division Zixibacteria bacterium]MDD4916656.1 zf-HC2 domain-containing protein [candidate division Zixibacteria bacterium]MDM7973214.1 zf-HC2 domain-containing protein [candidate division Zixibacteria bacterium]HOD66006.1 zf-HC2 domain-containing protein [candidate division Zixibacteria bacterium]HPM37896.1 zf-HC2 domain-containing protein [candidate division Zixibacteria bacterium]